MIIKGMNVLICPYFCFRANPINGFSCDYVYLIRALIDLYETTLDEQWLKWAVELQDKTDEIFWDSNKGGYFAVGEGDSSILIRMKDGTFIAMYEFM